MKRSVNDLDRHIGNRIRMGRRMMGVSQEDLGRELGVSFQQIQKYEKGVNRVGAGRLQSIAVILGVSITYFYEGLPKIDSQQDGLDKAVSAILATPMGLQLVKAFVAVGDCKLQRKIVDMVEAIVQASKVAAHLEKDG